MSKKVSAWATAGSLRNTLTTPRCSSTKRRLLPSLAESSSTGLLKLKFAKASVTCQRALGLLGFGLLGGWVEGSLDWHPKKPNSIPNVQILNKAFFIQKSFRFYPLTTLYGGILLDFGAKLSRSGISQPCQFARPRSCATSDSFVQVDKSTALVENRFWDISFFSQNRYLYSAYPYPQLNM